MAFSTKSLIRLLQKIDMRKSESNHFPFSYVFGLNFIPNMSACFSWANLHIQTEKLRKKIMKKRGLFVIPLQSNVTGSRYSYTWMSLVQENGWHVLLDATALGAKEMETLRLSLFDPDFHICSFFKVICENPSGFCCLFIKKSIGLSISKGSTTNVGIVSLVPPLKLEAPKGKAPL
ncbi:hypothetical protein Godav_019219 [Gossypium davidsonii]|uniref:Aminotransferase class V domain-containing protein n=2 Tax=Gossypium TaxID=3633 RepID=A0A7J8R0A2_GOSDV|nr:hypothetical protein [Gossypium davidsonii]MBA0641749.1 hypothetical protein [Gossypium klotzschianum]